MYRDLTCFSTSGCNLYDIAPVITISQSHIGNAYLVRGCIIFYCIPFKLNWTLVFEVTVVFELINTFKWNYINNAMTHVLVLGQPNPELVVVRVEHYLHQGLGEVGQNEEEDDVSPRDTNGPPPCNRHTS